MKTLIIAEKPKVSERIARALSPQPVRKRYGRVPYFQFRENGDEVYVASAAGHLYSLKQAGDGYEYPVFNLSWQPIHLIEKGKGYAKAYINALKGLSKGMDRVIIATDWDIEGELLGYNALRFACERESGRRMRFSTLLTSDLRRAYEKLDEIDRGLVDAGEARHIMDWYWGINISRALMHSTRLAGGRFSISAGRVQTPALAILARREREIEVFVPKPYYQLHAHLRAGRSRLKAVHVKGRFYERGEAEKALERSRADEARVVGIERSVVGKQPPVPFDLGALQSEAFRVFRLNPKRTQDIAQSLYEAGLISYPRTSSQKYPPGIGFRRIIQSLVEIKGFEAAAKLLEKPRLRPRQGRKEDPAHPAIYPTGLKPGGLTRDEERLYKLIAWRYLSVFADKAVLERSTLQLEVGAEPYSFTWTKVLEKGWLELYPYARVEEKSLPELQEGAQLPVIKLELKEGETEPPERYNPASLIRELERHGLGTKATRAEIVDTLYKRRYIRGVPIKVTEAGLAVIEALEKHVPELVDDELTRRFEGYVEGIRERRLGKEEVLREARKELTRILRELKRKEKGIGEALLQAFRETRRRQEILGPCPSCGGELRIIKSSRSGKYFAGCTNYPECKTSYPLPQKGHAMPAHKPCPVCGLPLVALSFRGGKVLSCIDVNCRSKQKR